MAAKNDKDIFGKLALKGQLGNKSKKTNKKTKSKVVKKDTKKTVTKPKKEKSVRGKSKSKSSTSSTKSPNNQSSKRSTSAMDSISARAIKNRLKSDPAANFNYKLDKSKLKESNVIGKKELIELIHAKISEKGANALGVIHGVPARFFFQAIYRLNKMSVDKLADVLDKLGYSVQVTVSEKKKK